MPRGGSHFVNKGTLRNQSEKNGIRAGADLGFLGGGVH